MVVYVAINSISLGHIDIVGVYTAESAAWDALDGCYGANSVRVEKVIGYQPPLMSYAEED